jgi:hypothetical protein
MRAPLVAVVSVMLSVLSDGIIALQWMSTSPGSKTNGQHQAYLLP